MCLQCLLNMGHHKVNKAINAVQSAHIIDSMLTSWNMNSCSPCTTNEQLLALHNKWTAARLAHQTSHWSLWSWALLPLHQQRHHHDPPHTFSSRQCSSSSHEVLILPHSYDDRHDHWTSLNWTATSLPSQMEKTDSQWKWKLPTSWSANKWTLFTCVIAIESWKWPPNSHVLQLFTDNTKMLAAISLCPMDVSNCKNLYCHCLGTSSWSWITSPDSIDSKTVLTGPVPRCLYLKKHRLLH